MATEKRVIGDRGESVAARYYESLGHTVIERNWTLHKWEVDLITTLRGTVHFVEVKSVSRATCASDQHGAVREAVMHQALRQMSPKKLNNLRKAVEWYVKTHPHMFSRETWQFDIAVVELCDLHKKASIEILYDQPV